LWRNPTKLRLVGRLTPEPTVGKPVCARAGNPPQRAESATSARFIPKSPRGQALGAKKSPGAHAASDTGDCCGSRLALHLQIHLQPTIPRPQLTVDLVVFFSALTAASTVHISSLFCIPPNIDRGPSLFGLGPSAQPDSLPTFRLSVWQAGASAIPHSIPLADVALPFYSSTPPSPSSPRFHSAVLLLLKKPKHSPVILRIPPLCFTPPPLSTATSHPPSHPALGHHACTQTTVLINRNFSDLVTINSRLRPATALSIFCLLAEQPRNLHCAFKTTLSFDSDSVPRWSLV
jgi:hypothetical protein